MEFLKLKLNGSERPNGFKERLFIFRVAVQMLYLHHAPLWVFCLKPVVSRNRCFRGLGYSSIFCNLLIVSDIWRVAIRIAIANESRCHLKTRTFLFEFLWN